MSICKAIQNLARPLILTICVLSLSSQSVLAQSDASNSIGAGPRRHLATIIYAGLGGAVLGLSTLSFYGRPQEKLSNIAIGFAVGVILGTVYVTYQAATKPSDFYSSQDPLPFETMKIAEQTRRGAQPPNNLPTPLSYQFTF